MMGIQLRRPLHQGATTLPVAVKGDLQAQVGGGVSLHAVEREGARGCGAEGVKFATAEQGRGQRSMGELVGGLQLNGAPGRPESASQRIGAEIESVGVL